MLYLTIAEFIKMNHDAATLIRCERLLAQAAFSILAGENPSTNRKPPEQTAAAFRELPAELPQELAERRQQALRQMTKNPETCQWQPTGDQHG